MPEFDVTGEVTVRVHKRVEAKTLAAAKRKAARDDELWWYDDIQYNQVKVIDAREVEDSCGGVASNRHWHTGPDQRRVSTP
jgi:hypothetical protein